MTFKEDIIRADKYESILMDKFDLEDVRHIKQYQTKDIDFLKGEKAIEVKIDFYQPNNFFFEVVSNVKYDTIGAILKTESDELWYYYVKTKELFKFDTTQLQAMIPIWEHYQKEGGDNAIGCVVPREEVLGLLYHTNEVI